MGDYAGAWLRVSSGGQDEASQEPDVMAWIDSHGYELAKPYRLHGKSASKGQQQQAIDEMLADMRAGLITVLVAWSADRIERRGALSALTLAEQVRQAGGRIEYVKDAHLNAANDMSDVMLSLAATMARDESRRKRERNAMARDRIKANGGFAGSAPWGLAVTGEKYHKAVVPTDEGRKLMPKVYAKCIDGESLARIARWLESETGRPWWPRSIGTMIRNPAYRGVLTDLEGRPVGRCEELVDAATWKRAGEALDTRPKRGPANAEGRAMLAGALSCPACEDSPMYRILSGKGPLRAFHYRCSGRGSARKGCGNMVLLDRVDAAVDRAIVKGYDKPVTERRLIAGNAAEIEAQLEAVRYDIAVLGKLDLPDEEYDERLAALRAQRDRVKATPVRPDRVEEEPTGERWSEQWARTPVAERGPWLERNGFRVTASRAEVTVTKHGDTATVPL